MWVSLARWPQDLKQPPLSNRPTETASRTEQKAARIPKIMVPVESPTIKPCKTIVMIPATPSNQAPNWAMLLILLSRDSSYCLPYPDIGIGIGIGGPAKTFL